MGVRMGKDDDNKEVKAVRRQRGKEKKNNGWGKGTEGERRRGEG